MRFQFQSDPGQFSYKPALFTDAIKILVSVNFGIFLLQTVARTEDLFFPLFGLVPKLVWSEFMIWQPFTYLFFHGGIWHLLINMFVLWMFGSELERIWGKGHFLKFYFVTGVGAGLVTMIFGLNSMTPIVGASGAVYGILLAYGITYPNRMLYIWGLIPVRSMWLVIIMGTVAFFGLLGNSDGISHVTHISGMIIGYILLKKKWRWRDIWFAIRKKTIEFQVQRYEENSAKKRMLQKDIDTILDKIQKVGFSGLSDKEQSKLYEASKKMSKAGKKD